MSRLDCVKFNMSHYLSVNIFLYGCCEDVELEHEFPSSIMSNFRLTEPNGLGLIAIGDILRLVANDLRVGDGDIPYVSLITLCRLRKNEKYGLF
jgi:hypothetical protein